MDLIIQYLIEKGGGFGVLLAISLAWIVFREKSLLSQKPESKEEEDKKQNNLEIEVARILCTVQEVKTEVERGFSVVSSHNPMLEQIFNMEKTGGNKMEKINAHITVVENKILEIDKKTKDLWDWHSVKDQEGFPIWYHRRGTEEAIYKLKEAIDDLDANFTQITKSMCSDLDERLQKVNDERVNELKRVLDAYNKTVTDLVITLEKIKFILKTREDGD